MIKYHCSPEEAESMYQELASLRQRITRLREKYADDYPDSEVLKTSWGELWVIEQSFDGCNLALGDWQKFGSHLRNKFNLTDQEWFDLWDEVIDYSKIRFPLKEKE
jgi:hypothetical protein